MCGLYGFAGRSLDDRPDPDILADLAVQTERRGRHAWGLAWIDPAGRLQTRKGAGPVSRHLGLVRRVAASAALVIGHCRWATHGAATDNRNNHPHPVLAGRFMHNGTVPEYARLYQRYGYQPRTDCDSEALGLLYRQAPAGWRLHDRWVWALERAAPGRPLALLALWPAPPAAAARPGGRIIVARRNGQPLHCGGATEGSYLASLPDNLPGRIDPFPDNTLIRLDLPSGDRARLALRAWPTVGPNGQSPWHGGAVDPAGRPVRARNRTLLLEPG